MGAYIDRQTDRQTDREERKGETETETLSQSCVQSVCVVCVERDTERLKGERVKMFAFVFVHACVCVSEPVSASISRLTFADI